MSLKPSGGVARGVLRLLALVGMVAESREATLTAGSARLLELIEERPGLLREALATEFGGGVGGFYYCLQQLEDLGLVKVKVVGRRGYVFPTSGDVPRRIPEPFGSNKQVVAEFIAKNPGLTAMDLVRRLEASQRMTYLAVRELVDDKYVTSASNTRFVNLRATPKLKRRLEQEQA